MLKLREIFFFKRLQNNVDMRKRRKRQWRIDAVFKSIVAISRGKQSQRISVLKSISNKEENVSVKIPLVRPNELKMTIFLLKKNTIHLSIKESQGFRTQRKLVWKFHQKLITLSFGRERALGTRFNNPMGIRIQDRNVLH